MKKQLIKTKTALPNSTLFEDEIEVSLYEDLNEALEELGSTRLLDILNYYKINQARIAWRTDKFNTIYPNRRRK